MPRTLSEHCRLLDTSSLRANRQLLRHWPLRGTKSVRALLPSESVCADVRDKATMERSKPRSTTTVETPEADRSPKHKRNRGEKRKGSVSSHPPGPAPGIIAGASTSRLAQHITWRRRDDLRPFPRNPRQHPEAQIRRLMKALSRVWTIPILIDETGTILCGHARFEAAGRLGMQNVPTITLSGLSEPEKRAIVIGDNKFPEGAVWNLKELRHHFDALIDGDFDVELTGFSTGEIDLIIDGQTLVLAEDEADLEVSLDTGPPVSQTDDEWRLGSHRILCGDALRRENYTRILKGEVAQMVVTDPPYNVKLKSAVGRGKIAHREFVQASGELSQAQFTEFLAKFIQHAIRHACDGAIHFVFMDWRHLPELLAAALPQYSEWKNLLVWNKDNAGQGNFYRNKHELIAAFKSGNGAHINNFGLGAQGRYRTNVIDCPSVNSLHPARRGDQELHPTTKPVALIADLIRDCSRRNGLILDPFGESGTALLAAERTGRRARLIELDPLYVDVAIRRWQRLTNCEALHVATGRTFSAMEACRARSEPHGQKRNHNYGKRKASTSEG
jgi:DNA modification methylase